MTLIPNWRDVLKKAWSVHLSALAFLSLFLDYIPYLSDYLPKWLTAVLVALAIAARVIDQGLSSEPAHEQG